MCTASGAHSKRRPLAANAAGLKPTPRPSIDVLERCFSGVLSLKDSAMSMSRREAVKAAAAIALAGRATPAHAQNEKLTAGRAMTATAIRFLDGLKSADRARVVHAAGDPEQFNWHFVP